MTDVQMHSDLSTWAPVPTQLPAAWMALVENLESEARGTPRPPQAYALNIKYDTQHIGQLLCSWGLPWSVVLAGYLFPYDEALIQSTGLPDMSQVLGHIREARHYMHCIEEDDLFTLLNPPYSDIGALLIAVAIHYVAMQAYLRHSVRKQRQQLESIGGTLLNIAKHLGMWYFKREIEDLTEQLLDPPRYAEDQEEHTRILRNDTPRLEAIRQWLEISYQKITKGPIIVTYTLCGIAGLRRRQQDAHTTATSQKAQLTGFDLATFDITVSSVQECYSVLGAFSQLGRIQDRVTDHIANPKPNGYSHIAFGLLLEAPSAALQGADEVSCQIQIGTPLMHAITRYGCLYPEYYQLYAAPDSQEKPEALSPEQLWNSRGGKVLSIIKEALLTQHVLSEKQSAATDEQKRKPIIVYAKNRNPVTLPKGATALDFAYAVDINLGAHAVEAFINNRKAPLYRTLDAGDIIEIRTSRDVQIREYWLDQHYATIPKTRRHIQQVLKQQQRENREAKALNDILQHHHFRLEPEELDKELNLLVKQHKLGTYQSYLERLDSTGEPPYTPEWAAQQIMQRIRETNTVLAAENPSWLPMQLTTDIPPFRPHYFCSVCQPRHPRDMKIVGHLRKSRRDIIIHSVHCPRLSAHVDDQHSMLLPMVWQSFPPAFKVAFFVEAQDRRGLVHDITRQLRRHQCLLLSIEAEAILKFKKAEVRFVIETYDDSEVLSIRDEVRKIESVTRVEIDAANTLTNVYKRLEKLEQQTIPYTTVRTRQQIWEEDSAGLDRRTAVLLNPYNISRPAEGKMFFGRSDELKSMKRVLCDDERGKAVVLYGPRRSGKSSLCKQFLSHYVKPPYWHTYCSLQGDTRQTEANILMRIAEEVCYQLREQLNLTARTWQDYTDVDPQVRFKHVLQGCLAQIPDSRLILVLDEFGGALESYEKHILEPRFFTFWRNVMGEFSQLSLMLALPTSSHTLLVSRDLSSAFSFAESLSLSFLDRESAQRLLVDPLREKQIAVHPGAAERATQLTNGNPYYMNLIGLHLIHPLNQEPRKQKVFEGDLTGAIDHIIGANSSQYFSFYRSELQDEDELRILEAIVELSSHTTQPAAVPLKKIANWLEVPARSIRPRLERLRNGLILDEYQADHPSSLPYYAFKIELVWHWMKRNSWFFEP
jgi:guanosine-3',5'-bis(diphosphate) 3'-pyrophosphohydrolase